MSSMAMADYGDFATGFAYGTAVCDGDLTSDELDVGMSWTVMVLESGWRCVDAGGAAGLGGGSATVMRGGRVTDGAARAQEACLRRVRRRTSLSVKGNMMNRVFVIVVSADRAGARLPSARCGPCVQSRIASAAMDDIVNNLKDGDGTSRVRRDPTRVTGRGSPRLRVGLR